MPTAIIQLWEESERYSWWGVRPDGYSIHPDNDALASYIAKYWDGMPDETPDEYSRPSGEPYTSEITQKLFDSMNGDLQQGYRVFNNNYPKPK